MARTDPNITLPRKPRGAKKGSRAYKEWAKEAFCELLRYGYSVTAATEYLGLSEKWRRENYRTDPSWKAEVELIRSGVAKEWQPPDLSGWTFAQFVEHYFGITFAEHQIEIADLLEDPMTKLGLVLGFPESGKSTMISLWYPLFRLAQNPDMRIALVSKSTTRAQDLLTRIKRYLTEEHLYDNTPGNLVRDFRGWKPTFGEMEWSQSQIYVRHRKSGERDPSVQALGIGKQIYGARLDLLILDDALILENQRTEDRRQHIDTWFTNEALSRVQRGQAIVNGTRIFPQDLYGQWKKSWASYPLFRGVYIPAILDEGTENERASWPEYWTLKGYDVFDEDTGVKVGYQEGLLDIKARIVARDASRWRLVYQQEDVEETENIFTMEHVNAAFELGADRSLGQVYPHEILILGVDPATTGRAAALLMALDPGSGVRTVVDLYVGSRLGATGIKTALIYKFWDKYREHGISFTVIEENFAPTLLVDEGLLARAEAANTSIQKHQTIGRGHRRGAKWDEEYGIAAQAALFAGGLIAFPSKTEQDRTLLQPLIDDMLTFPWSEQQDALITLWICNSEADIPKRRVEDIKAQMDRRGIPPIIQRRAGIRRDMMPH